jgi:hypothetical protein
MYPLKETFHPPFSQAQPHHQLDSRPLSHSANQIHHIPLATYCLPHTKFPKMPNQHIFTLKMATAMFAEILGNFQHLMQLISESQVQH